LARKGIFQRGFRYFILVRPEVFIMMKKYDEAEEEIARKEILNPESAYTYIRYYCAWVFAAKGEKEKQ